MRAYLDFQHKKAKVVVESVVDAGWLGFDFARNNPDLVQAGWRIHFFSSAETLPSCGGQLNESDIQGAISLARTIKAGPPKSCCHGCCCCKGE